MNKRLQNRQDIAIVTLGGVDFLSTCPPDPRPVYVLYPGANQVHPNVELYTMTDDEIVNIDDDDNIQDGNGNTYSRLISPRPKNIIRR